MFGLVYCSDIGFHGNTTTCINFVQETTLVCYFRSVPITPVYVLLRVLQHCWGSPFSVGIPLTSVWVGNGQTHLLRSSPGTRPGDC